MRVIGFIADNLANTLLAAGHIKNRADIMDKFGGRLGKVGELAYQLNIAIGELFTSGNLDAIAVPCGAVFNPLTMDDGVGYPFSEGKPNIVLCTTELGLLRSEKVCGEGRAWWPDTVLLKPKVALDSLRDHLGGNDET
jgi:hypothetical protein